MSEEFVDPYTYPGSRVLRNLLDQRTAQGLAAAEYELTLARRYELEEDPITGPFDFDRLKETHRRLFQDVYAWAGSPRTVEISKGASQFHPSPYIDVAAQQTFEWLGSSGLLNPAADDDSFVALSAELLEKVNYIHPFREGNGRTQRAFLDQVAVLSGRTLSWRNISPDDHLRASVNAFRDGSGEPFHAILRQALRPPIDGLSPLDPETYAVSEPSVAKSDAQDAARKQEEFYRRFPELRPEEDARHSPDAPGPELG